MSDARNSCTIDISQQDCKIYVNNDELAVLLQLTRQHTQQYNRVILSTK